MLRFVLAMPSTAKGLRRQVLILAPLPVLHCASPPAVTNVAALPAAETPGSAATPSKARGLQSGRASPPLRGGRPESKTARFLALVIERHGELANIDPAHVSRICSDLAPQVGLNEGSARSALRPAVLAARGGAS